MAAKVQSRPRLVEWTAMAWCTLDRTSKTPVKYTVPQIAGGAHGDLSPSTQWLVRDDSRRFQSFDQPMCAIPSPQTYGGHPATLREHCDLSFPIGTGGQSCPSSRRTFQAWALQLVQKDDRTTFDLQCIINTLHRYLRLTIQGASCIMSYRWSIQAPFMILAPSWSSWRNSGDKAVFSGTRGGRQTCHTAKYASC